ERLCENRPPHPGEPPQAARHPLPRSAHDAAHHAPGEGGVTSGQYRPFSSWGRRVPTTAGGRRNEGASPPTRTGPAPWPSLNLAVWGGLNSLPLRPRARGAWG